MSFSFMSCSRHEQCFFVETSDFLSVPVCVFVFSLRMITGYPFLLASYTEPSLFLFRLRQSNAITVFPKNTSLSCEDLVKS